MKWKNLLLTICLMLLLAVPVMALDFGSQLCTGLGYRSADGGISEWVQAKIVTQVSENMFVLLAANGTIENAVETKEYAIGPEISYLVTKHLMVRFSTAYLRTNIETDNATDIESPLISIGADYYLTDVLKDQNELIGASLSIVYNPDTKNTGLFAGAVFWFGKDNASK